MSSRTLRATQRNPVFKRQNKNNNKNPKHKKTTEGKIRTGKIFLFIIIFKLFEAGSWYVAQAGLEFKGVLLPEPFSVLVLQA